MNWTKNILLGCILSVSLITVFSVKAEEKLLRTEDIRNFMDQILEQHVDKKKIGPNIVSHSFRAYIEQFDPDKIYLLEDEVRPFLSANQEQLLAYAEQYKNNDYSSYHRLNLLIQASIERSRHWREDLEAESKRIFEGAPESLLYRQWGEKAGRPFAVDAKELKKRVREDMIGFIEEQKGRFGPRRVMNRRQRVLRLYEDNMREHEDPYMTTVAGQRVSQEEQEHEFTLHVLKALARSLDTHTRFFDRAEAYDMRVRLQSSYKGAGVLFEEGLDGPVVAGLVPDSPAEHNGKIQIGDALLSVNGSPVFQLSFQEAMRLLRDGEKNEVEMTFSSSDKNIGIFSVRLEVRSLMLNQDRVTTSYETFGDGFIGVISLKSFYQNQNGVSSESDVREAIRRLREQGPLRGLVLDLRENSGGYLSQAVKVAGLFITDGIVVISKYYGGEERYYRDLDPRISYNGPLVVLTSRVTASAAEIVAQTLQDYGVALIVGAGRTYGKGTVQRQTVTEGEGASFFKVTVGKYYTVSGKSPQDRGVEADIIVPGVHGYRQSGEEILDYPTAGDTIAPAYSDNLQDVQPALRGWYMQYYLPNLQQKKDNWRRMISVLQKNSRYRLEHNRDYQAELNESEEKNFEAHRKTTAVAPPQTDVQLQESLNIVKDMFLMEMNMECSAQTVR